MSQRLWLIGIVADVAAVVAVLAGSARTIAVVVGVVALLLGTVQLVTSVGKPVDRWVLLAVAGIVAGAVTVTLVVDRALVDPPAPASGATSGTTTTSAATQPTTDAVQPTSRSKSAPATPEISRATGDKPIRLTEDYGVDLDSRDPVWIAHPRDGESGQDLYYDASYLWAPSDIAPVTAEATFEDCQRAGYEGNVGASGFVKDAAFCVKTNTGAHARIVIVAMESGQATLDIVVWQKPTR